MEGSFVRSPSIPKGVRARFSTFRIEDIPDDKREQATQHLRDYFFKDEPITSVVRKTTPYSNEDIYQFVANALNENISLYAIDEANNEEIAGVTIVRVTSRCNPGKHNIANANLKTMRPLVDFFNKSFEGADIFTYKSGSSKVVVDYVLEPMGLSVATHYRGKGIGQALIKARHQLAGELGVQATQGLYTSIYSQAIILGEGMELIKDVPYADYLVDGKAIFAELNPPHRSAQIIGGLLTKDSV